MFILKFIFYVFLFLFILGFVLSFFLKRALRRMAKKMNNNFTEQQNFNNPDFSGKQRPSAKRMENKGEYVDFEEIKE